MDTIHHITDDSDTYPPLLREIAQPPTDLYLRGNLSLLQQEPCLAVVGSRKASKYGQQALNAILPPVIAAHTPIISGLAFGIDALAHRLCVSVGASTIAVLGSGIDEQSIYPKAHISLAHQILANNGLLISEYPPGTAPFKSHFPARNRIIAGMSYATLVVQASKRSGSLITSRLALEANREVWAVPGPITDPLSQGTNTLIQQGATPILAADDLLSLLNVEPPDSSDTTPPARLSVEQQKVLHLLSHTPVHVDVVSEQSKLPPASVSGVLVELELLDQVQHLGGMKYVKKQ